MCVFDFNCILPNFSEILDFWELKGGVTIRNLIRPNRSRKPPPFSEIWLLTRGGGLLSSEPKFSGFWAKYPKNFSPAALLRPISPYKTPFVCTLTPKFSPAALLRLISPYKTPFVCTLNPQIFACGALIERPSDFLRFSACYKGNYS